MQFSVQGKPRSFNTAVHRRFRIHSCSDSGVFSTLETLPMQLALSTLSELAFSNRLARTNTQRENCCFWPLSNNGYRLYWNDCNLTNLCQSFKRNSHKFKSDSTDVKRGLVALYKPRAIVTVHNLASSPVQYSITCENQNIHLVSP